MKGKVMWYDIQKGYGKIKGEDGKEYFAHRSQVPFWSIYLNEGDTVSFEIMEDPRGPKAVNISSEEIL